MRVSFLLILLPILYWQAGLLHQMANPPVTHRITRDDSFSKLKALLRKAAKRTMDALWAQIGKVLDLFTPEECANYFVSCGYVNK
ncbi:hypothetical protein ABF86_11885 [Nitrosomonas sp. GH22]|nr:hypothetical protein [Nitrosomonas sp. GH22]